MRAEGQKPPSGRLSRYGGLRAPYPSPAGYDGRMPAKRPLVFGVNWKRLADELEKARLGACAYDRLDPRAERPIFTPGNPWASWYWSLERFRLMQR